MYRFLCTGMLLLLKELAISSCTPVKLKEYWYVVLKPDCHVNTAEMFSHQHLKRDTPPISVSAALNGLNKLKLGNDFQSLVCRLYPEVEKSLMLLSNSEYLMGQAMMSGSGACVFAPFASWELAEAALSRIDSEVDGFIARGVNVSPLRNTISQLHACKHK